MTPCSFLSVRTRHLALCGTLLTLGLAPLGHAQRTREAPPNFSPPSFVPPAPPNFTPPAPPSGTPGAPGAGSAASPAPGPAVEPAAPSRAGESYPSIVDPFDPRLDDPVGVIQIPDLGTNDVLSMLEEFTGKSILRQQSLPAVKVTFFSQGPMTRGEAIRAIESSLALNGIAVTRVGEQFLKAVPAAVVNSQAPIFWEGTTLGAPPTQQIYEKIFQLGYLAPSEAAPLVQPIVSQGTPIAFEKSGLLMVTDALTNLQRIERLLSVLDAPSEIPTEVLFFSLKNASAQDVVRRLQQIQQGPLARRLQGNTTFDGDEKMNQLLVFTHPSNVKLITDLIDKMDIDVAPVTTTKVYSIRYAEALEVVNIIEQVVTGQKQARDQNNPNNNNAARQQAQQNQAAATARAEAGSNLQFSDLLTLVADERANSVVASGTHSDITALDRLINEIDVLLAQVRIEAVIVEVSLSEGDATGISSLGAAYLMDDSGESLGINPFDVGTISILNAVTDFSGSDGETPGIFFGEDGEFSMGAIIGAVKQHGHSEVLSAPTIVTTHNREAKISVGERRPIITGTSSAATTGATTSSISYQNIGIELSVTPLIGSDGIIQLEIEQSIEDVGVPIVIDGNEQNAIISRQASSFVSVGDGQLVVLGGLQRNTRDNSKSKFPILGQLPILDKVFTRTTEDRQRTEIILFLRPKVIRTAMEADNVARSQLKVMDSRERIESYLEHQTFKEYDEQQAREEAATKREIPRRNKP